MADRPALSKSELEIARILWDLGESSVRAVHEALPAGREMDFATVQTYLRRLEAKGYVKARLEGRMRLYAPKIKPRTVIRETVDDLVDRLFGGEPLPLVRHLLEDGELDAEDISDLRDLLDRLERERKERVK